MQNIDNGELRKRDWERDGIMRQSPVKTVQSIVEKETRRRWEIIQSQSRRTESRVNRRKTRTRKGYRTKENNREFCELFDFVWVFFFSKFCLCFGFSVFCMNFRLFRFFLCFGFCKFFLGISVFSVFSLDFFRLPRTVSGFGDVS